MDARAATRPVESPARAPALTAGRAILLTGFIVAVALPFAAKSFLIFQLTLVLIYAIAICGLNLLTGFNGQFSLGHGAFYALGAYTAAILMEHGNVPYLWTIPAAGIVCFTISGSTARRVSRERPAVPLLVLTPSLKTARRLGLLWGAHAVRTRDVNSFEEMVAKAKRMALRHGLAKGGDRIVVIAGVPFGTPGSTNVVHVVRLVGDELERHKAAGTGR